jgi:AcrR family transcriptional regulator
VIERSATRRRRRLDTFSSTMNPAADAMASPSRRRRETITVAGPRSAKQVMDRRLWTDGRARIAETALPLFLKYGYHATPVRVIARAAGISSGSVFNYFSGKEEILKFILDASQAEAEASVAEAEVSLAESRRGVDPVELFLRVYRRYAESIDAIRRYALLAYQEAKSLAPRERAPLFARERRIAELLKSAARPAIQAGSFSRDALDLKIQSLIVLAHAWAVRHWAWSQYETVADYWKDLEPVAVGIMSAHRRPTKPRSSRARGSREETP